MTPETFRRAKEIFHGVLERPAEGRAAFIEEACAGDADVKAEVMSLLASEEDAGGFLEEARLPTLPGTMMPDAPATSDLHTERRRIGPYTILHEIGRGGMGSVYLAERSDREYRGQVALKLVRRGMDTDFILQRFRAERQILASLNHPNIAKLLDGGTTDDGLPYFVMEYIEGEHLTDYCRERDLPLRKRIELFRTVCSAVQFAHRNLVVHRDIKPSNLMVTGDGTVKLLDFGLAKVLDPQKSGESFYQTVAGIGIFTPEYASPEQVRSEPVTTATDVYSLGVVLYELLAGVHPYRRTDSEPSDILKAILETEPAAPSTTVARNGDAARALQGDLDTIVLMALRKEPERRYATVEKLSADLGRYLEGLPVSARPDTLVYRAGKFVRRHRVGVAAALLVFVSLAGGLGVALWQAQIARQEQALAQRRFDDVRHLANTLIFELNDALEKAPGTVKAREVLVQRAVEYLGRLAPDTFAEDAALQRDVATAYERLADLQGGPNASLGNRSEAVGSLRKAVALRQRAAAGPGASIQDRLDLARIYANLATHLDAADTEATSLSRTAVDIAEAALQSAPSDPNVQKRLAIVLFNYSTVLEKQGNWKAALEARQRQSALFDGLAAERPESQNDLRNQSLGYKYLAGVLEKLERGDEAETYSRRALAIDERRLALRPSDSEAKTDLSYSLGSVAGHLSRTGKAAAALDLAECAALLSGDLAAADRANAIAQVAALRASLRVAELKIDLGRYRAAADGIRAGIRRLEPMVAARVRMPQSATLLARHHLRLGDAVLADRAAARKAFATAVRMYDALAKAGQLAAFESSYSEYGKERLRQLGGSAP